MATPQAEKKQEEEQKYYVSPYFPEYVRPIVPDPGLDETYQNLTPERIEQVIKSVIGKKAAHLKAMLETCVKCGLCAQACQWYLSHDGDPTYAPVAKVNMTLGEMLRRDGKVEPEFIRFASRVVHTECNICHRCSMYCPFGLDITAVIRLVRRICLILGVVPQRQLDQNQSFVITLNQVWLSQNDYIDALLWQEEEGRAEIKRFKIPIDKEGAEIMWCPLGAEPKTTVEHIYRFAKIFNVAGTDWTMSSDKWDVSNMPMFLNDYFTMIRVVRGVFESAKRLRVKRIVITECGHANYAMRGIGPVTLGYKDLPFKVQHALEYFDEIIKTGKVKIDPEKRVKEPVTLHDPCNSIRRSGLAESFRSVARALCEDFRDMQPNREHNFCCNSGGGLAALSNWAAHKARGNRVKAEQIMATGAKKVITPCHNCHTGIGEVIRYWKLPVKTTYIDEILAEAMVIPDELKVESG